MKATQKHYVITVGASAGGLEAIQEFFDHMPQTGNMSFVVIQHLSPDYKSLLVDLVGRRTDMKVLEAAHNMPVLPNSVYVIPNNKQIRMQKGKLVLSDKVHDKSPNNAIDVFLHSLALDKKDHAIAVILSGTGTDGTKGIAAIKENGGCVMVQEPASAKFDGMPNSALASGYADVVDTPAGIAEAIVKEIFQTEQHQNFKAKEPDEQTLSQIFELIYKYVGHDFHYYKTPTILRRINKRMLQHSIEEPEEYVKLIENNPDECKELAHDFLISVTKFFRDADAYKILSEKVLPELIASKESGDQLKIWVSACSTGEEAYSIAMTIDQVLEETGKELEVKIFASDIDTANLDIASNALYPFTIESDVPEPFLNKYFVKKTKGWSVAQRLRKQIVFARHDITKDPPFIKNDLVTCRNMLIYMNSVLQDRIYAMLQFSLNKDGFLFLGPSENPPFSKSSSMQQISMKWKIFKKLADVKQRVCFSDNLSTPVRMPRQSTSAHVDVGTKGQKDLWKEMRMAFLEDLGYIAFYIDRNFEIHETMGNYEDLLSLPKKMLNLNLIRMLPQDLSLIVNRELRKAWKNNKPVQLDCVVFGKGDNTRAVNILLKPSVMATGHDYTLVMFSKAVVQEARSVEAPATEPDYDYVRNLEAELAETKNSLQLAVEDLETANEELQSSNEELLSSNEELQSSNEELQSLNEELYTLNTEHQVKIKELLELNDDMNNYFRSTNIAQIFLDAQLNIRKFNPASTEIINFIETDLGRPFSDITANFKYNQLLEDIREVERTRSVVEKEVTLHQGKNFLLRIMPYITREKKYAGVIITFVDITTITNLNNIIRSVFNATTSAIFALHTITDQRGKITDFSIDAANEKAQEWFGAQSVALIGKSLRTTAPELTTDDLFGEYLSVVLDDVKLHRDLVIESMDMWFELTAAKMPDGLVVTFTDITDKKKAVHKIRRNYSELNDVKENLRRLNKELEDKVKDRTRELSFSEERFRLVARATNDALWDWDLTVDKVWWSDAFRNTFGHVEIEMNRKAWLEHVHPDDREAVKKSVHTAIHDNYNQWSQEYRFRMADGEYANVLDRGYILHNEFGVPYRMLGSMLDLTALRKAEQEIKMMNEVLEEKVKQRTEQLQEMNQELESSNRDLQLFASVASHDLQEPLRKIHMLTKMVKDRHADNLGEDTVVYLNKIMQSATRMKALVNNILHFSKLSNDLSGFELTDVAQIIKDVREDFEMMIRDKNAEITVSEIPKLEVIKSHIQQVFQNLIGNALKFSRMDVPPVITISAWRINEKSVTAPPDDNGRWCHIEVRDNGIGFDEQFRTRIFDLFQRLNSKDKFEGTGIGLAIVKKIVEKHNGFITANSQEGNGAVFSIILPLEQSSR